MGRDRGVSSKMKGQTYRTGTEGQGCIPPAGGRREARRDALMPAGKDAALGTAQRTEAWKGMAEHSLKDRRRATESNEGGDFLLTHAVQEESFPETEDAYDGLSEEKMSVFSLSPEAN